MMMIVTTNSVTEVVESS